MRLATYIYYPNFLSKKECKRIVKEGTINLEKGTINPASPHKLEEVRETKVSFICEGSVVQDLMIKIMKRIDSCASKYYGCDLTYTEPIQYAEYTKGMFYNWHTDSVTKINDPQNLKRDISASLILNSSKKYTGGSLELITGSCNFKKNKVVPEKALNQEQGTLIVFPSSMLHRVTKVKSGVRKSLVLWSAAK
tara:strand:+ start:212 stop:790 length:579 start_codon:yes stop_codon:yes gene_type:complete